jgi:transposase
MVSAMKIADTKPEAPFRVRVNRTGRRTFSREYKLEIIEECSAPGASVAAVALSHGINANQVRKWIVQHRAGRLGAKSNGTPTMLPITLGTTAPWPAARAERAPDRTTSRHGATGIIEVEFDTARLRVRGAVDAAALGTVLEALAKR